MCYTRIVVMLARMYCTRIVVMLARMYCTRIVVMLARMYYTRIVVMLARMYFLLRNSPSRPGSPHCRGFMVTLRYTTLSMTPLDE